MMPSTSKAAEKEEEEELEEEVTSGIQKFQENPEEMEEIVVVGDDIQEEIIVDGEEIIFADDEEGYGMEYDACVSLSNEKNLLFDMYQPHPTENGTFLCKICMRTGKEIEYPDRPAFVAHRYKCHGSFNNNVMCPLENCREVYASLYSLRRHLGIDHKLPLEIHLQTFSNIGEFERYRHLIELASGCKYMMHTKQPKYRRQVMHCAKSEHKLVLQTAKHRLPHKRMNKEGSACPSVISYRVAANGEVSAFMQLFHVGHGPDQDTHSNADNARPIDIVFPLKPACWAGHAMQYVQIDVQEVQPAVYGNKIYEYIVVVTCLKTRFMWARQLTELTRTAIGRILNAIFNEYGVPEGFSTAECLHPTYIRDTMKSLETVYSIEIREIWSEPLPYPSLVRWVLELAEHDLQTRNRWVEQLSFVVMEYNQKHIPERDETPFERMFNRKAPNLYQNGEQHDMVAAKCRKWHSELRREDQAGEEALDTIFEPRQKVFLRKGITKPRRGNNTQFYFGLIGEFDPNNQFYPYKVHYSSTDSPWPTERSKFVWVSVYDLLPTIHGISEMSMQEKRENIARALCCCNGEKSNGTFDMTAVGKTARASSRCLLFRNIFCANQMSKFCCKEVAPRMCRFHEMYPENDESYAKMDSVMMQFVKEAKEDEKRAAKEMHEQEEMMRMAQEEEEDRIRMEHLQRMNMGGQLARRIPVVVEDHGDLPPSLGDPHDSQIIEEVIEEELLEPAVPLGERDTDELPYHYDDKPEDVVSESSEASTPLKRMRRKKSSPEVEKRMKMSSESPTSPSSSASMPTLTASRRASQRKTIRPKNLNDYVE